MLSLTRAVVGGVARAPPAVCQGGVTFITRFNSTAQVPAYFLIQQYQNVNGRNEVNSAFVFFATECSEENNIWTFGR